MKEERPRRRDLLRALCGVALIGGATNAPATPLLPEAEARLAELEKASGGRLGVFAIDTETNRALGRNEDSAFGMCSTFKLLLAAAVLREADAGRISLDRIVRYDKSDMVFHAPVTSLHLGKGGLRIRDLAEAAQTTSDNVAANLLIAQLGGPAAVTSMLRAMGDNTTRLDRLETEMNLVPPGEIRDTTTPRAMAETVSRVLTGNVLKTTSRALLIDWMSATRTGMQRIRAGLPSDWRAGDKTGTATHPSMPNKHNDVAIFWPPNRKPVIVAAYFDAAGHFEKVRPEDDAVLAKVGTAVVTWTGVR